MNRLLKMMDWKDQRGNFVWQEIVFDMTIIVFIAGAALAWVLL